jgi:predicted transcriptional regulator
MTAYGARLFDQHAAMLAASKITPEHARDRGYVSVDTKKRLEVLKVVKPGRRVPGLLIPQLRQDGSTWGWQYRPDEPRTNGDGKPVKYETPWQQRNGIDVPPGVGPRLGDPSIPLFVTEGVKKADSAACAGLACIALPGVWSWLGKNPEGGKVAVADWRDVALNDRRVILAFDSDVVAKKAVRSALDHLAAYLEGKGAKIEYLHLPNNGDGKTGIDDYVANGHTADDLWKLVRPDPPEVAEPEREVSSAEPPPQPAPQHEPITLKQARAVFTRWLGKDYDLAALDATLSIAACTRLDGDPPWLLIVSGSGNAKTETVMALTGAGAIVTSTIDSPGALLSATSRQERASDATGGLLRKIGDRGLLVIKDFTSILSMDRNMRSKVLAGLREVADGYWERNVGVDGGRSLTWRGRVVLIGAVTTAYDSAHGVITAMGDRFMLLRVDSTIGRKASGRQALRNVSHELTMRSELAAAAAGVIAGVRPGLAVLDGGSFDALLDLADLVTLARTAVERDYKGDVIGAHQPEMPTRFAKMLAQVVRGGLAIGMEREYLTKLATRIAGDSVPPLRLNILGDVSAHPHSTTTAVAKRLQQPRTTVDRVLQELHALRLLDVEEAPFGEKGWRYFLADDTDAATLALLITRNVTRQAHPLASPHGEGEEEESKEGIETGDRTSSHISGDATESPPDTHLRTSRSHFNEPGRQTFDDLFLGTCEVGGDISACLDSNCRAFGLCVLVDDEAAPT